jgi:hypothetical protein
MPVFKVSDRKDKKYSVITPSGKKIHFGNKNYHHYKDSSGLGIYSHLDHLDKKRRASYRARHKAILKKDGKPAYLDKEQPAYYSYKFLW